MVKISRIGIVTPFSNGAEVPVRKDDSKKRPLSSPELVQAKGESFPNTSSTLPSDSGSSTSVNNGIPVRALSYPSLHTACDVESIPLKKRIKRSESSVILCQKALALQVGSKGTVHVQTPTTAYSCSPKTKPDEYFRRLLESAGASSTSMKANLTTFLPISEQQHDSYPQAAMAARNEDLPLLKKLHAEGKNLQCANKFGESIIHIVCRRCRDDILNFLVSEAGVSLRVRDDLGRTPLHDAAWTDRPNFKIATQLLKNEPDLLFVKDNRGNSPLAYVPQHNWGQWNRFLEDHQKLFLETN